MTAWYEDERFWEELYPFLFPREKFEAAEDEVERILELTSFRGQEVLDLACGPGRHSLALARRGYRVTGVDLSPFLIGRARSHADAAGVNVEWVIEDMRSFVRAEAFDLVLIMYTSFGYFDDREDDRKVLDNVWRSLRPAGACVVELFGKELLARNFEATACRESEDGVLLVEQRQIYDDWSRIRNKWVVLKSDGVQTFRFHHRLYSGQEMKDLLRSAGFRNVRLYGDLDGTGYGVDARRLVAVAWK